MMRWLVVAGCLIACSGETTYVPRPLPPLVAPTSSAEMAQIQPASLGFSDGERFVWEVWLRGMSIGRLEMTVEDSEIRSHFATTSLARAFATVEDDLVTTVHDGKPTYATERLDLDGSVRQRTTTLQGTTSHSLHTALGAIRMWAKRGAAPGFLLVVVEEKLARVELQSPSEVQGSLRVDGKVLGLDEPVSLSIWMDAARTITRIVVRAQGEEITASRSF